MKNEIRFYRANSAYGWMSNFSRHPIEMDRKVWPTVEHYFQAQKFHKDPERQEGIRLAKSPGMAKRLGRGTGLRPDWNEVKVEVMQLAVLSKFEQHPDLAEKLLNTLDAVLIEDSPTDSFWGCGADGKGKNMLGEVLLEVRDRLSSERPASSARA